MQRTCCPSSSSSARSTSSLYGVTPAGAMPHDAQTTILAPESAIRAANSSAPNPPNTTEWMAPRRAHASIAITASGTIGM